jgi:hypothetical protein
MKVFILQAIHIFPLTVYSINIHASLNLAPKLLHLPKLALRKMDSSRMFDPRSGLPRHFRLALRSALGRPPS